MPHVSSQALIGSLSEKLFEELAHCFVRVNSKTALIFLNALLTQTERIMFAKRVAVIALLREEYSVYHIAKMLHMSTSTVSDMAHKYEHGDYQGLVATMKWSKGERQKFWNTLEIVLRAGLPSRAGKDRWQWLGAMKKQ